MGIIVAGPGAASVFSSASGGKIYAYNAIDTAFLTQVAPANPSRQKLTFHNPGTVDIYIAPVTVLNAAGASITLTPTTGALGGCFLVFANGGTLVIEGECTIAWQALAKSGSGNALTVMDSNL